MKVIKRKWKTFAFLLLVTILAFPAMAQHNFNNSAAQYYRDGYLWNPAIAGFDGSRIYGLFSTGGSGFEDAPKNLALALDLDFHNKMGGGLRFHSFSAGALTEYSGALSYAYELKFDDQNSLRLGGELSLYNQRIDSKYISDGGQVDPVAVDFNNQSVHFDGNIGAFYNIKGFSIGAVAYNLSSHFKEKKDQPDDLEVAQFQTSYRFTLENEELSLTPLVAYKMFSKLEDYMVGGVQFQYDHVFHAGIFYQSTDRFMGGVGFMLKKVAEINFFYTTKNKDGYFNKYEVGLKFALEKE